MAAAIALLPMTQQDSLAITPSALQEAPHRTSATSRSGYHSPREILSWLPRNATPAQQDSAIRAHYRFPEIDWTRQPNPLRTPQLQADTAGHFSLQRPMYHAKSLVQPDSVYRPEYAVYRHGVAGDPIPYTIAGDNLVTSILLGCFVLAAVAVAESGNFIQRQIKNFFHTQREGTTVITETSSELRFQVFLLMQAALLFALIFFFYSKVLPGDASSLPQYAIICIFTGINLAYFALKAIVYSLVGWVFFDKKKNEQWNKAALFLTATEGMALFPVVMLHAYFGFSIDTTVFCTVSIIILTKLLALYKTHLIFFKRNGAFLQSFLYFCTFETMPLGALWGVLVFTDNYLKVNF